MFFFAIFPLLNIIFLAYLYVYRIGFAPYLYKLTHDEEGRNLRPRCGVIKSIIHLCFDSYDLSLLLKSLIHRLECSIIKKNGGDYKLKFNNKIIVNRDKICDDLVKKEMIVKEGPDYKLEFYGVKEIFIFINQKAREGNYDIESGKPAYDFMRKNIKDRSNRKIEYPSYYNIEL